MKTWKLLKSLSDKDVITISTDMFKFSDFLKKLKDSISTAFGYLPGALKERKLASLEGSYRNLIDDICIEEDELSLLQIFNDPELVSYEVIKSINSESKKQRLTKQRNLGISGELLQIGTDWKPCKVVVKMHIEVYVEEEEPDPAPAEAIESSPLDDIRQTYSNPTV